MNVRNGQADLVGRLLAPSRICLQQRSTDDIGYEAIRSPVWQEVQDFDTLGWSSQQGHYRTQYAQRDGVTGNQMRQYLKATQDRQKSYPNLKRTH